MYTCIVFYRILRVKSTRSSSPEPVPAARNSRKPQGSRLISFVSSAFIHRRLIFKFSRPHMRTHSDTDGATSLPYRELLHHAFCCVSYVRCITERACTKSQQRHSVMYHLWYTFVSICFARSFTCHRYCIYIGDWCVNNHLFIWTDFIGVCRVCDSRVHVARWNASFLDSKYPNYDVEDSFLDWFWN